MAQPAVNMEANTSSTNTNYAEYDSVPEVVAPQPNVDVNSHKEVVSDSNLHLKKPVEHQRHESLKESIPHDTQRDSYKEPVPLDANLATSQPLILNGNASGIDGERKSRKGFWLRKRIWITLLCLILLIIAIAVAVPIGVVKSRQQSDPSSQSSTPSLSAGIKPTTTDSAAQETSTRDPSKNAFPGTKLSMMMRPDAGDGFLAYVDNAGLLSFTSMTEDNEWVESQETGSTVPQKKRPISNVVVIDESGREMLYFCYVAKDDVLSCDFTYSTIPLKFYSTPLPDKTGRKVSTREDITLTASPGIRYNSSAGSLDGGFAIYACTNIGTLEEYQYDPTDNQWSFGYSFSGSFGGCGRTSVIKHANSAYLFVQLPDSDRIKFWVQDYVHSTESTWMEGYDSPWKFPNSNSFCSDGEFFAYQDLAGTIQGSTFVWNDTQPAYTTWDRTFTIMVDNVMDGSSLACEIKNTQASVVFQAPDGGLKEAIYDGTSSDELAQSSRMWRVRDVPAY